MKKTILSAMFASLAFAGCGGQQRAEDALNRMHERYAKNILALYDEGMRSAYPPPGAYEGNADVDVSVSPLSPAFPLRMKLLMKGSSKIDVADDDVQRMAVDGEIHFDGALPVTIVEPEQKSTIFQMSIDAAGGYIVPAIDTIAARLRKLEIKIPGILPKLPWKRLTGKWYRVTEEEWIAYVQDVVLKQENGEIAKQVNVEEMSEFFRSIASPRAAASKEREKLAAILDRLHVWKVNGLESEDDAIITVNVESDPEAIATVFEELAKAGKKTDADMIMVGKQQILEQLNKVVVRGILKIDAVSAELRGFEGDVLFSGISMGRILYRNDGGDFTLMVRPTMVETGDITLEKRGKAITGTALGEKMLSATWNEKSFHAEANGMGTPVAVTDITWIRNDDMGFDGKGTMTLLSDTVLTFPTLRIILDEGAKAIQIALDGKVTYQGKTIATVRASSEQHPVASVTIDEPAPTATIQTFAEDVRPILDALSALAPAQ